MIYIVTFTVLLGIHWLADFVCQTNWQASNKSKNLYALLYHVATYTLVFAVGSWILFGAGMAVVYFILANGFLHFVTDFVTSRITSRLYSRAFGGLGGNLHWFFVVVGLDQLIHHVSIAATLLFFITI